VPFDAPDQEDDAVTAKHSNVCMYVLVAAAAIIWAFSSSAGALPLLRHDDDHLHITPKASKQADKI
jgi:hypothetical protein